MQLHPRDVSHARNSGRIVPNSDFCGLEIIPANAILLTSVSSEAFALAKNRQEGSHAAREEGYHAAAAKFLWPIPDAAVGGEANGSRTWVRLPLQHSLKPVCDCSPVCGGAFTFMGHLVM